MTLTSRIELCRRDEETSDEVSSEGPLEIEGDVESFESDAESSSMLDYEENNSGNNYIVRNPS